MPRKRMIDPSFWTDEKVGGLSPRARLTFIALWNFAEDSGVGRAHTTFLKNTVFPYDEISVKEFEKIFDELVASGLIVTYTHQSQNYYYICNFKKHQKISHPAASKLPLPTDIPEDSGGLPNDSGGLPNDSGGLPNDSGKLPNDSSPIEENIKENNINQLSIREYGSRKNIPLSGANYQNLCSSLGQHHADELIEKMSLYLAAEGKTYQDYYAALRRWADISFDGQPSLAEQAEKEAQNREFLRKEMERLHQ